MFLIDTNCWMQIARSRDHADKVRLLLAGVPLSRLFVSIYSVHSIGTILARRGWIKGYADFLNQASIGSEIGIVAIPLPELVRVEQAALDHRLDFDDAYQYVAAELNNLSIVSLDADFDRTPRGRLTPTAALQRFTDEQRQGPA